MAIYKCPVETCNVELKGAVPEIVPRAIGHARGSHQTTITEDDVRKQIAGLQEAQNKSPEEKKLDLDKWWDKINK